MAPKAEDLDPAFGYWFAGFSDGEGCFSIKPAARSFTTRFSIGLRIDDLLILEEIQTTLGLGDILLTGKRGGIQAQAKWSVCRKDEMTPLIDVFERFPLRAKKASDFEIWKEAVDFWLAIDGNQRHDWTAMGEIKKRLTANREFDPTEWVDRFNAGPVRSSRTSACPDRTKEEPGFSLT